MTVHSGLLTVEEFSKLREPKEGHLELHHGEVVLMPPPKWGHQQLQTRISLLLMKLAANRGVVQVEMAYRPAPEFEVWQADVGYVSAERARATADDAYLMGAPDLAVEVLSPGNTAEEINDKMAVCIGNGCLSFWVVDGKHKRISVTEGDTTKHYGPSGTMSCAALPGQVAVEAIFG